MSIRAIYKDGVFKPLEDVKNSRSKTDFGFFPCPLSSRGLHIAKKEQRAPKLERRHLPLAGPSQ